MREPSGAPAPAGVLFPELLASSEPAPPARPRGARLLKGLARVLLWSLITVGALRGLMPDRAGPTQTGPATTGSASALPAEAPEQHQAEAVAAAFLREYLTVGEDRAARAQRLGQFTARGVDLRRSVAVPAGVAQYTDLVVPAGNRSVAGGVEVTVVAHVLQVRSDGYRDGGTLAFIVPLAVRREGIGVAGRPRPTTVPFGSRLSLPRPRAVAAVHVAVGSTDGPRSGGRLRHQRQGRPRPPRRWPAAIDPSASLRLARGEHWPRPGDRPGWRACCAGAGSRPAPDRTCELLPARSASSWRPVPKGSRFSRSTAAGRLDPEHPGSEPVPFGPAPGSLQAHGPWMRRPPPVRRVARLDRS